MENEKELRQLQKEEAVARMRSMRILPQVIRDFEKNGKIYYSERQSAMFPATLYWLDNHSNYVELVKAFEERSNGMVYHCQLTHTEFGDLLSMFYVSRNPKEWTTDRKDLENGLAFVMVENLNDDLFSECGYIEFRSAYGGVVRIN